MWEIYLEIDGVVFYTSALKVKPSALREAYLECGETSGWREARLPDRVLHYETIEFAHLFQHLSTSDDGRLLCEDLTAAS